MTMLKFRLAAQNDAPSIQELVQSAFRAEDTRKDWTADMSLGRNFSVKTEEVLATIAHPDKAILIALTDDHFENLVASIEISKRGNDHARFSMISVGQAYQQAGVGRRVLAYAEQYCQENWGSLAFELNALSTRQELIAWYERRGYRKTGETSAFPVEKFPSLALPEDMCFVELEKAL